MSSALADDTQQLASGFLLPCSSILKSVESEAYKSRGSRLDMACHW